jgi:hypothetical protein
MAFRSRLSGCAVMWAALLTVSAAAQEMRVGAPAPGFTATDSRGQTETLAQYRGKYVVLEWHNRVAPTLGSIMFLATCKPCRKSGLRRAWSGSR